VTAGQGPLVDVTSIFMREGKREEAPEALLVIKAHTERHPALQHLQESLGAEGR
jgi:uncharacterized protein involved in tolerance to divalent cations